MKVSCRLHDSDAVDYRGASGHRPLIETSPSDEHHRRQYLPLNESDNLGESMSVLKKAKRAVLAVAKGTGAYAISAKSGRRNSRLLVLGYHGVSLADEHEWHPALFLSPDTFRGRLESLKRTRCTILPLQEALDRLYRGDLPERAVALTFDDGTYDFRQIVWPMLKEYGYPATLYWTTYWVTIGRPVVPVIWNYLLWKKRGS